MGTIMNWYCNKINGWLVHNTCTNCSYSPPNVTNNIPIGRIPNGDSLCGGLTICACHVLCTNQPLILLQYQFIIEFFSQNYCMLACTVCDCLGNTSL